MSLRLEFKQDRRADVPEKKKGCSVKKRLDKRLTVVIPAN